MNGPMNGSGPPPLLEVEHLRQTFHARGTAIEAVRGVSFHVHPGEAVALVGESGSGKSTVARCLVRLLEPTGGAIRFAGQEIAHLPERDFRPLRRNIQMVFQDPTMSLNPRLTVRQTLSEPLLLHGVATRGTLGPALDALMDAVRLDRRFLDHCRMLIEDEKLLMDIKISGIENRRVKVVVVPISDNEAYVFGLGRNVGDVAYARKEGNLQLIRYSGYWFELL